MSFRFLIFLLLLLTNYYNLFAVAKSRQNEDSRIIAINDTFHVVIGCGDLSLAGFVLSNDFIPEGVTAKVQYVMSPNVGLLSFGPIGNFVYNSSIGFNGEIVFKYSICDNENENNYSEALVSIFIVSDFDCDGVPDIQDIDIDNDGLLNLIEGNGEIDSDGDGVPDIFDIDDDNDGIPDNTEWQIEKSYIMPSGIDENKNGWDDIYESQSSNGSLIIADTDHDGTPDFLDEDSDNDSIPDYIEATDLNSDFIADFFAVQKDSDKDGLDDSYDNVSQWNKACNPIGSNVPLPDHNNNGIRDFREKSSSFPPNDDEELVEVPDTAVSIYPNPTDGLFTIKIPFYTEEQKISVQVLELDGKIVNQFYAENTIVSIDLSYLKTGIYIARVTSPQFNCTKKFIVKSFF